MPLPDKLKGNLTTGAHSVSFPSPSFELSARHSAALWWTPLLCPTFATLVTPHSRKPFILNMNLAFASLLFMVATAVAAAVPPRHPHDPIAAAPESSSPSSSVPQDPTSIVSAPTSDPSASDTNPSRSGSSGPPSSTDVSTSSSDAGVPTSATSVHDSSTEAETHTSASQTSSTDSLTSTGGAPTITPGQRSTTSDSTSTSIASTDVPPPSSTPSPSSSTAPSKPSTSPPTVDKQTYLNKHNRWRGLVGAADLQWSDDLAAKAQSYAEQCQLQHSNGALGPIGENLVAGTGSFDAGDAMTQFVLDKSDFNPGDITFSHFTQVIWSSTTQLGCGVALCDEMFPGRGSATYHVCLYDPVGNVIGEERLNLPHYA
ncbi:transporter [Ganoderma sinense ZZ0214-1]|uniref:Transporter n=1 Tax=Ganoderma sinense ZZ0214-1 TaxID=1077348 RepID=A0A2G8SUF9_9APHY|nr:transporter [Ganoderma sinense ZZ0214-1]